MDQRKQDRLKRIGLIALRAVGILVALVAVLVGGLFVVLKTDWGGERLRRQVVTRVNQQIQGRLGIDKLSFGGDRLTVWGVTVHDPDGALVAQVARAEVDFRIGRLLRREVRVTAVAIESPRLMAVSDEKGLNLTRATAPRHKTVEKKEPPKPRKPDAPEGWVIQLDRFNLSNGEVRLVTASGSARRDLVHFTNLRTAAGARYATGNGSTDLTFLLDGQGVSAPSGPLSLKAEARVRGDATHVALDGRLLGGTVEARGDIDRQRLDQTDALVAIAIPRTTLAGFEWGPLRVDGRAHPGAVPTLDLLLAIPGVELAAKGAGPSIFKLAARLAVDDLSQTSRAVQALTAGEPLGLAGHGAFNLGVEGPLAGAPASLTARLEGGMDQLRAAQNTVSGLKITGRAAQLSTARAEADLEVKIASVLAGASKIGDIQVGAKLRQPDISAQLALGSPEPLNLELAARLDNDQHGLVLSRFDLSYARARWRSERDARLRFADQAVSLQGFRLRADKQTLAVDASKDPDNIAAHLAVGQLRLDLLPAVAVDPQMKLGGTLDVDAKASGDPSNPKLAAQVRLQQARFKNFTKIDASLDAALADQKVAATLAATTPFAAVDGRFNLPVDPLGGGPLDVNVNLTRLDLSEALRGAGMPPRVDGRLAAHLRVTGDAASPKADLTVTGRELDVRRPPGAGATAGEKNIEVGHARIRLTYENRAARADIDFAAAHGGVLRVDAAAKIDLGYPKVTQGIVVEKIPIHGKVVAKDLDVAWVAQFNPRVETLGGQVNADAKIAGTVGDPQFVGDVRWKNGKVVATSAPETAPAPARRGAARAARRR